MQNTLSESQVCIYSIHIKHEMLSLQPYYLNKYKVYYKKKSQVLKLESQ